jgi:hypothetical protein
MLKPIQSACISVFPEVFRSVAAVSETRAQRHPRARGRLWKLLDCRVHAERTPYPAQSSCYGSKICVVRRQRDPLQKRSNGPMEGWLGADMHLIVPINAQVGASKSSCDVTGRRRDEGSPLCADSCFGRRPGTRRLSIRAALRRQATDGVIVSLAPCAAIQRKMAWCSSSGRKSIGRSPPCPIAEPSPM